MIDENTQSMLTFGLHTHTGKYTHMPKKKKKVEIGQAKQTAAVLWRPLSGSQKPGVYPVCSQYRYVWAGRPQRQTGL